MTAKGRTLIITAAVLAAGGVYAMRLLRVNAERPAATAPTRLGLAAPGRVEPGSEERVLSAPRPGIITAMMVDENDHVRAGQVLAELDRADLVAQLHAAQAGVELQRAQRARLSHGARVEERHESADRLAEAEAHLAYAVSEYARRVHLRDQGAVASVDIDAAQRELDVAKARRNEAAARSSLVSSSARADELAIADAEIGLAQAKVAEMEAQIDKTFVRAPIDGTVLHRFAKLGESVGTEDPTPLFVVGALATLNVRAEIDELDVARVHVGDRAYVTADAYPNKKFGGKITRVAQRVAAKNIVTDRPGERQDRKVLETLIALDPGANLPIGLRVDVFVE
jgi:HlyD family secretion protein